MNLTKTDEALAAAVQAYANDPERVEALQRTRRFKTSWIELAEALTEIRKSKSWERWGYGSFETYFKTELHLRQETVDKLTGSYLFLKSKAPDVFERDAVSVPLPNYQAVDLLRRAEEKPDAPADALESLRKAVIEEGVKPTAIPKEVREAIFPVAPEVKRKKELSIVKSFAGRLRTMLGQLDVVEPELVSAVDAVLERLMDALAEQDAPEGEEAKAA